MESSCVVPLCATIAQYPFTRRKGRAASSPMVHALPSTFRIEKEEVGQYKLLD